MAKTGGTWQYSKYEDGGASIVSTDVLRLPQLNYSGMRLTQLSVITN